MKISACRANLRRSSYILPFALFFLSGCTSYRVGGQVQPGRYDLHAGNPKAALVRFQRAAELDPNYVTNFTILRQGVWTYIGKAHYAQGDFSAARKAFEQARSRHADDNLAKLYLGLVLSRDGERDRGRSELEAGLRGIRDWLDYIEQYHPDGRFWDPGKYIRSEIQKDLTMISSRDINWPELIASGERVGELMEKEIDSSEQHRRRDRRNDDGRDDGRM